MTIFERALAKLDDLYDDVFVVNIGAFDGRSNEHFFNYLRENKWSGILVEPSPQPFAALTETYAGLENVTLANVAIADKDGTAELLVPVIDETSPHWLPQTSSLLESHVKKTVHEAKLQDESGSNSPQPTFQTVEVKTMRIATLLQKHQIDHFHALKIDAEGYDFRIIKQLDFSQLKPDIIIYEYYNLSYLDNIACLNLLRKHGYKTYWHSTDILAIQADQLDQLRPENMTFRHNPLLMLMRRFPLVTSIKNIRRRLMK